MPRPLDTALAASPDTMTGAPPAKQVLVGEGARAASRQPPTPKFETSTLLLLSGGIAIAAVCTGLQLHLDTDGEAPMLAKRGAYMLAVGGALLWLVSIPAADVSTVDLWWAGNYVAQAWLFAASVPGGITGLNARAVLLLTLVSVWGLRLFMHLTVRKVSEGWVEDSRYPERVLSLRRGEANPFAFHTLTLVQVFVMQSVWMWLIGQPLLVVFAHAPDGGALGTMDYIACGVWLVGFVFEAGSDLQLQRFKVHRQPGQVCSSGFFRYTRHPNYFGDSLVWLSFYLFAVRYQLSHPSVP